MKNNKIQWILGGIALLVLPLLLQYFGNAWVRIADLALLYQFWLENWSLGTPRGGRRTVPMRVPSSGARGVPRRTMRKDMVWRFQNLPAHAVRLVVVGWYRVRPNGRHSARW